MCVRYKLNASQIATSGQQNRLMFFIGSISCLCKRHSDRKVLRCQGQRLNPTYVQRLEVTLQVSWSLVQLHNHFHRLTNSSRLNVIVPQCQKVQ